MSTDLSSDPMLSPVERWRAANKVLCLASETFDEAPVVDGCLDADEQAPALVVQTTATTDAGGHSLA